MKTMANEARLDGKRLIMNHSAKKTRILKLNDRKILPNHIMQLSP